MSPKFNKVKEWYDTHRWTKSMVHDAVGKWITAEEYKLITGEDYEA
jgi:hypothetical protein